jgi:hypothetical protein
LGYVRIVESGDDATTTEVPEVIRGLAATLVRTAEVLEHSAALADTHALRLENAGRDDEAAGERRAAARARDAAGRARVHASNAR